jgi:hypothetical protein
MNGESFIDFRERVSSNVADTPGLPAGTVNFQSAPNVSAGVIGPQGYDLPLAHDFRPEVQVWETAPNDRYWFDQQITQDGLPGGVYPQIVPRKVAPYTGVAQTMPATFIAESDVTAPIIKYRGDISGTMRSDDIPGTTMVTQGAARWVPSSAFIGSPDPFPGGTQNPNKIPRVVRTAPDPEWQTETWKFDRFVMGT